CFDAKKAAAFPRNSLSIRSSCTSRRSRSSSARSSPSNGASVPPPALPRSAWTHRPSSCSPTPISRATAAIGRPVSITRCAASRRYSGVYVARFFLLVPITDILPDRPANTQIPPGQCPESGVNLTGALPGASGRGAPLSGEGLVLAACGTRSDLAGCDDPSVLPAALLDGA